MGARTAYKPHAALDWAFLQKLHEDKSKSSHIPHLPHTIELTGSPATAAYLEPDVKATRTFEGTPSLFLPILKELCRDRFDRPLITWNIWNEEPPSSFPLYANANEEETNEDETDDEDATQVGLRDERLANGVTHMYNRKNESQREEHNVRLEEWAEQQPKRVSQVTFGHLYLVQLEAAEGEFHLGLARVQESVTESDWKVYWYERLAKHKSWGSNGCQFKQYMSGDNWGSDTVSAMSILLEVQWTDLTASGQMNHMFKPYLSKDFMAKVRWFISLHNSADNVLVAVADDDEEDKPEEDKPSRPEVRPEPKARATSSNREDRAKPVHSVVVAANREATAKCSAADALAKKALAEKAATKAAAKAEKDAKLLGKQVARVNAEREATAWALGKSGSGTAQETSSSLANAAPAPKRPKTASKPTMPAPAMPPPTGPPATAAVARVAGSKVAATPAASADAAPAAKQSKTIQCGAMPVATSLPKPPTPAAYTAPLAEADPKPSQTQKKAVESAAVSRPRRSKK